MRPERATLTVRSAGLHTRLVGAARPASRSLGVPVGGAADRFALAVGNALVGNPADDAALEVTLLGPTLTADAPLACVVWGAPFALTVAGRALACGRTFTLEPGDELRLGAAVRGVRAYLCIAGGLDAPILLGSRSALEPVAAGATFPCRAGRAATRILRPEDVQALPDAPCLLRVLPGGQADWFPESAWSAQCFRVTPASNRLGLRLAGEPLPFPDREMPSEPVCPGTVQVTRDGNCIVLGVDGGTIGGYPCPARVISADLDRLGQLRPGDELRFVPVTLDEAERLWHERVTRLRALTTRLRVGVAI